MRFLELSGTAIAGGNLGVFCSCMNNITALKIENSLLFSNISKLAAIKLAKAARNKNQPVTYCKFICLI